MGDKTEGEEEEEEEEEGKNYRGMMIDVGEIVLLV
jgi:hypothetical protein